MNILAFDTSSSACSIALQCGDNIRSLHKIAPMQQARLILPMIQELMSEFSLEFAALDAIAYGRGPGSFTGIRIASSVAQGIAFAAQKPVISVSSLAILAETMLMEYQCANTLVAVDARMDQIYWAAYAAGSNGHVECEGEEYLCAAKDIPLVKKTNWCGAGDGWEKYADELKKCLGFTPTATYPAVQPEAKALLALARIKFENKQWTTADQALPVYLR
jgi:tRNA threonylcarbamoyladenosine biosynthesis protein TsaB